jgi:3-deoxy-D-manno-octulosonate 8-phosphate phosphatase (KDO 8-P phosphatase)
VTHEPPRLRVALFDIDGVLTDGRIWIGPDGGETKVITFDDVDAIFRLKRAGVTVGFFTGEDTAFCDFVRRRFEPDVLVTGCKDKLSAYHRLAEEHGWDAEDVCFTGDGWRDIPLLEHLSHSFAPSDAAGDVRGAAQVVVGATRGNGVVAAVTRWVLGDPEEEDA